LNEDWMHGALQEGCLNVAMRCYLQDLETLDSEVLVKLERFLKADWNFPKHLRCKMMNLWTVFNETSRSRMSDMKFKCSASNLIGLYILFRHFVYVIVPDEHRRLLVEETRAFENACRVVDIMLLLKKSHCDLAHTGELLAELRAAVDTMISSHVHAYGDGMIRPKHHRMQHMADQIQNVDVVIDAFIIERLHLVVKDALSRVHNPKDFEASLMRYICNNHLQTIRGSDLGLVGAAHVPGFDAVVAHSVRLRGLTVSRGDLVQRNGVVATVLACSREASEYVLIVDAMRLERAVTPYADAWKPTGTQEIWPAMEAEHLRAWYSDGDCVVALW
jgi:hypothetical protein